ncbi:MAG: hypothetical protein ACOCVC_09370 [Spirochaeta sp.]
MHSINPQQISGVIHLLNEHGIQTAAIYEPIGCIFHPSPQDIIRMIEDSDAFFADECGLSKTDYVEWKAFAAEGCRCTATTKKGMRCRKHITNYHELSPQEYVARRANDNLYCALHSASR